MIDSDESTIYTPSPEEIAAACLEIQSTWSGTERIRRRQRRPKLIPTDPEQVRRDAQALLDMRLVKMRSADSVELSPVATEPDEDAWQLEPCSLE